MTETTTDPWTNASEASSGSLFQAKDYVGKVLLFQPKEYTQGIKTKFSKTADDLKDMVQADVTVIAPKVEDCDILEDQAIFQGFLIGKLKGKVGNGMVLGKLITTPTDKGNDAYDLEDASPEAQAAARAWYQAKVAPPF